MEPTPKPTESKKLLTPPECQHEVIQDLIDITPDRSQYVYYCNKCYACFDGLPKIENLRGPKDVVN